MENLKQASGEFKHRYAPHPPPPAKKKKKKISAILCFVALVYNWYFIDYFRTAVLRKLLDIQVFIQTL